MKRERILIAGGPGTGKSTLAEAERSRLRLPRVLCTDTATQAANARGVREHVLYAPATLDGLWSELSQWVASTWFDLSGPWIIEGVAVYRALAKWHDQNPGQAPPCDRLVWLTGSHIDLSPRQYAMQVTHDNKLSELTCSWHELSMKLERTA